MTRAISNTSPLQYLYRAGAIHWLPQLFEEDVLIKQAPSSKSKLSPLNEILQTVPRLSHSELLELIVYLAQQARQIDVTQETYYWRDIAGIAPDLMKGQDAQEWTSQVRQEWERDQP